MQWETKMLQSDVINKASANEAKQAALTALTQSALRRPRQAQDQKQITLKIDAKQKSKTNKNSRKTKEKLKKNRTERII